MSVEYISSVIICGTVSKIDSMPKRVVTAKVLPITTQNVERKCDQPQN